MNRRQVALAGHTGDAATARDGLSDPDPSVRATALGALARLGGLGLDDIRGALGDGSPRVRARASELAGSFGAVGRRLLVEAVGDRDPSVVEAACFALGESGQDGAAEKEVVDALSRVSSAHSDALCREAAVAALGSIGDPAGLEAILAATSDKPAVRRRAVLALAPFSGQRVDAALEAALSDRDWQVRQAAEDLVGGGSEPATS